MIVEQIWTDNPLRNFVYLVACEVTGDALAIDPLDYKRCLDVARQRGWTIRQVINTHEHPDHTGGNKGMLAATGATLIAHHGAVGHIENVSRGVGEGDRISVGSTVEFDCLDTPGHTMTHICLLSRTTPAALFSGDTLFAAGVGNCHHGGDPEALYETYVRQLYLLDDATLVYTGHDYLLNNLRFTLDREPDNDVARRMLERYSDQDPNNAHVTTIAEEREINCFFRLQSPGIMHRLTAEYPELGATPDERSVFLKLRELRNNW